MDIQSPLTERAAGILLHPTSLPPSTEESGHLLSMQGTIGLEAYRFIDWASHCGFKYWQILPLTPPHGDGSPYQSYSAFAGNPALIDFYAVEAAGWLPANVVGELQQPLSEELDACWHADIDILLQQSFHGFRHNALKPERECYHRYLEKNANWIWNYACFCFLKARHEGAAWLDWPEKYRNYSAQLVETLIETERDAVECFCFEQYLFHLQWNNLKRYAEEQGIHIIGDMPIFVAHDSSDVWAHTGLFFLDDNGLPSKVAGVPPDYFSETGQRWGNPLYDWHANRQQDFAWWRARVEHQLQYCDLIRIDHFRGFDAYWAIPAEEETAMNGQWEEAPGEAFFQRLQEDYQPLPLIAEDLGVITESVNNLRLQFHLPGMKILQFAFSGEPDNPYLPHQHEINSVVYTGTHDNDTTLGWYQSLDETQRQLVDDYLASADMMPWTLIRTALASVSRLAIIPMQDILSLDAEHRMNTPGTCEGNWRWQFDWQQVDDAFSHKIRLLITQYGRLDG